MKQSTSQIFNSSKKSNNKTLSSVVSLLKNNSSTYRDNNRSLNCLNFPKLYPKLKYSRNKINNENKSFSDSSSISENKTKLDVKSSLQILHFPLTRKKQFSTDNHVISNYKNKISNLYQNRNLNSINKTNEGCSPMFFFTKKQNGYTKFLSDTYYKNNRKVINMFNTRYKERTDSILNVKKNEDGYCIKGIKYKKYYFFPHEKMNILLFHKKIMAENLERFEKRRKIENIKKLVNKNIYDKRRSISNDDIFVERAFNKRKTRKFYTRNFYTKRNLKNRIENVVDYEINKFIFNKKLF